MIVKVLKKKIQEAFRAIYLKNISLEEISLQITNPKIGNMYTLIAYPYNKLLKDHPEKIAQQLTSYLQKKNTTYLSVESVKGFVNIQPSNQLLLQAFEEFIKQNYNFFKPKKERILIEIAAPNTNKPLHLGHLRNSFLGESIANLLKNNGYEVYKVMLMNDRGIHICKSMLAYKKFGQQKIPESTHQKGDQFVGSYYVKFDEVYTKEWKEMAETNPEEKLESNYVTPLLKEAQEMLKRWEAKDPEVITLWNKMNNWVYKAFQDTFQKLNITFDHVDYESELYEQGKKIVKEGLADKVFYQDSQKAIWVDLEKENLGKKLLLRGDDTAVYITQDLAVVEHRYQKLHFDQAIYVVGSEQDYHFKVLFKTLEKLKKNYAKNLKHVSYGMVHLPDGKMKSRKGNVVDADELIEQMIAEAKKKTTTVDKTQLLAEKEINQLYKMIGIGALKFFMLSVNPYENMTFHKQESIQLKGDTASFIQYTHARIQSLLRNASIQKINWKDIQYTDVAWKLEKIEYEIVQQIIYLPNVLQNAAENYNPSLLTQYLLKLTKKYNHLYSKLSILSAEEMKIVSLRLCISEQVGKIIAYGMKILGIEVPDVM